MKWYNAPFDKLNACSMLKIYSILSTLKLPLKIIKQNIANQLAKGIKWNHKIYSSGTSQNKKKNKIKKR